MSDLVPDPVMAQMVADGLKVPMPCDRAPSVQTVIDENARLRALLERARTETNVVRAANESLRRERVEVEQALGRSIHAGELGPAVKMALYRETGR